MRTMTRLLGRTVLGPLVLGLAALGAFALPGSALASTGSTRVIRPRRTERTIPDYLALDAPSKRLDIIRGVAR